MKRFMYLSIGVLCLSIAALIGFHLGSRAANAQASDFQAGWWVTPASGGVNAVAARVWYATSNGDVYYHGAGDQMWDEPAVYLGNFFGSTVPTSQSTIGGVKSKYR